MQRDVLTPLSPSLACGPVPAVEDLLDPVSVVEIDVYDDAFEICMETEGVRGTDYNIVEVAISPAEIGRGVMAGGTDKRKRCCCPSR